VSALTEFFFDPVRIARSNWSIVSWWETRRPIYNVVVGAAGICSLAAAFLFAALPPHPAGLEIPLLPIVVYAVLANLGYSLGPAADVVIRRRWGDGYAAVGPTLFRYGFVFSVGLTLLPIPIAALSWLIRVLQVLF
jgi:hypothetical protein